MNVVKDLKMFRFTQHDEVNVPLRQGGSPKDRGISCYFDLFLQIKILRLFEPPPLHKGDKVPLCLPLSRGNVTIVTKGLGKSIELRDILRKNQIFVEFSYLIDTL